MGRSLLAHAVVRASIGAISYRYAKERRCRMTSTGQSKHAFPLKNQKEVSKKLLEEFAENAATSLFEGYLKAFSKIGSEITEVRITGGPSRWDLMEALFSTDGPRKIVLEIDHGFKLPVHLLTVTKRNLFSRVNTEFWIEVSDQAKLGFPVILEGKYSVQNRQGTLRVKHS